jgi:hypothetical protein
MGEKFTKGESYLAKSKALEKGGGENFSKLRNG